MNKTKPEINFSFTGNHWITRRTILTGPINKNICTAIWFILMSVGFSVSVFGWYKLAERWENEDLSRQRKEMINSVYIERGLTPPAW